MDLTKSGDFESLMAQMHLNDEEKKKFLDVIAQSRRRDEAIKEIREWLNQYGQEKCEEFLAYLLSWLQTVGSSLDGRKIDRSKILNRKKKLLKVVDETIKQSCLLMNEGTIPPHEEASLTNINDNTALFLIHEFAFRPLTTLATRLKKDLSEARPGRPPEWPSGLNFIKVLAVQQIASLFAKYFEKPTYSRVGPFFNVVKLSFSLLGWSSEAPDRYIKAALKAFKAKN